MSVNRRTFAQSALAAAAAGSLLRVPSHSQASEKDPGGLTKDSLPTPALLLDADAFEANLKVVAEHCRKNNCAFRPHAKTHKCPAIAKRQVESGALGICVATVPEALSMVQSGIPGVLLTSPIIEKDKIARIVALAKAGGEIMVSIGDVRQADLLSQAADAEGATLDVLVDVDVIDRRTGALPGQPALKVAQLVDRAQRLRLRGIQAYAGGASHTKGFARREKVSREAMAKAVDTRDLFAKSGLDTSILSGGSTGTYNIDSHIDGVTELQLGSYVFMDVGYMGIGSKSGSELYNDFRPSLTVLTTVVSATHQDLVTVDAGVKSMAASPTPIVKGFAGFKYRRFGDEFGAITSTAGEPLPRLGDRLEMIVPHCDPTVNLYGDICVIRGDKVEALWEITARRRLIRPART
jgi:D-serine deaminase-like pyridoxal phosphate-dependent protein